MKGPLKLRLKIPGDPRQLTVTTFINVKRGGLMREDVQKLSKYIQEQAAHLMLILTDRGPSSDALEELELLPQVVLVVVEQRDLVKLLVISFAKYRGIDLDDALLSRAFGIMFDKFGLRDQIVKWIERMSNKGYLLTFEGFVGRTAKACRFFINTVGKPSSIKDCSETSWRIRNLLPFGIESKIIPDMGVSELEKHAKILKDYKFVKETQGRHRIVRHPAEQRVIELLQHYGGAITEITLRRHFIFRLGTEHIFESLLDLMERKLLISREHGNIVHLLKLPDVKRLRDDAVEIFERKKLLLRNAKGLPFAHIVTWKERGWELIALERLEKTIEALLSEVAIATDEEKVRSYSFLILELTDWYGHYVDKIILAISKGRETVRQLELEVKGLEGLSSEVINKLVKATKVKALQVELQELQKARNELTQLKQLSESSASTEELETMLKPLTGDKKATDKTRKERLFTDVDEDMRARGVRGEWTVGKYLLIRERGKKIRNEIEGLHETIASLDELSQELVNITDEISKLFMLE